MTARADKQSGQSVVVKADEVLELLRNQGALSIARIAQGVGEPRTSMYRLMATLEQMGFVERGRDGNSFQLGLRLFALGQIVESGLSLIVACRPTLAQLVDNTDEAGAFLMIRHHRQAICLERRLGTGIQSVSVGVGGTLPLHIGAAPMVLLAYEDNDFLHSYLAAEFGTDADSSEREKILKRVKDVRSQGYAISDGDLVDGIAAVAAPVRDTAGKVVAALSVEGARAVILRSSAEPIIKRVMDAAASIVVSESG